MRRAKNSNENGALIEAMDVDHLRRSPPGPSGPAWPAHGGQSGGSVQLV